MHQTMSSYSCMYFQLDVQAVDVEKKKIEGPATHPSMSISARRIIITTISASSMKAHIKWTNKVTLL